MMVDLRLGPCLDLLPSVPSGSVDLILCDLPYGTTACPWDVVIPFAPLWAEYRRVLKPSGAAVHPTQKPVGLMEYLILTYTNPGETVLDNAFGSCTTGVACVNTGRRFIGMEKSPKYFAIGWDRVYSALDETDKKQS